MCIEEWWPKLSPQSRQHLIGNNGDALPAGLVEEISRLGGGVATDGWWVEKDEGPTGFYLSDAETDWIEAVANGESPPPPRGRRQRATLTGSMPAASPTA